MKKIKFNLKTLFQSLLWIIPIGVLANVIYSLVSFKGNYFAVLKRFNWFYLVFAIILSLIPWLTNTLRVYNWTRFIKIKSSILECFCIVLGGELGGAISPTAMGGGYVKLGLLIEKGLTAGQAFSIMSIGSIEDYLFFAVIIPVILIFYSDGYLFRFDRYIDLISNQSKFFIFYVTALLALIFISFLFRRKIRDFFRTKIRPVFSDYVSMFRIISKKGKKHFFINLALTSLQWACRYSVVTVLMACFHIYEEPLKVFLFQWIVFTLTSFIPTPGGSGGAETAFYFIFKSIIPGELIVLVTAGWRFLTHYLQLMIGSLLFTLLFQYFHKQKKDKNERNCIRRDYPIQKPQVFSVS